MANIFEMNYQNLYEIDITPSGATRTWKRIGAGFTSADPSNNETKDQSQYLDGNGFSQSDITGAQYTIAFSGHRVKGDPAQDYIFSLVFEIGDNRKTNARRTDAFGNVSQAPCTISDIDDGGGDAGAKKEVSFSLDFNGKPAFTAASAAPALSAVVAPGTVTGTTSFTATAGVGNTLAYKLLSATQGTVNGGSYASNYNTYTSGANIAAVVGQVLCMYELDAAYHVVKYLEETLVSGDIM